MSPTRARPNIGGNDIAGLEEQYHSRFGAWDKRASVRVRPRRTLGTRRSDQLYFPPEMAPVTAHPLVLAQGPGSVEAVLVQRLYQYLHFTTELELAAVMPVTMNVSRGRAGLVVPAEMRTDAFKITTDEAWHAQFSDDLLTQVVDETGIAPVTLAVPRFIERLDEIRHRLEPGLRGAQDLLFSIVSETLISSLLADIPKDTRVPTAVREMVADHAEDEGKHHAYFRQLLLFFWPALSAEQRRVLGPVIPDLIFTFLEPDARCTGFALFDIGLDARAVEQVLAESYVPATVTADISAASRSTVRYFIEVGALEDPATADAFERAGLC